MSIIRTNKFDRRRQGLVTSLQRAGGARLFFFSAAFAGSDIVSSTRAQLRVIATRYRLIGGSSLRGAGCTAVRRERRLWASHAPARHTYVGRGQVQAGCSPPDDGCQSPNQPADSILGRRRVVDVGDHGRQPSAGLGATPHDVGLGLAPKFQTEPTHRGDRGGGKPNSATFAKSLMSDDHPTWRRPKSQSTTARFYISS